MGQDVSLKSVLDELKVLSQKVQSFENERAVRSEQAETIRPQAQAETLPSLPRTQAETLSPLPRAQAETLPALPRAQAETLSPLPRAQTETLPPLPRASPAELQKDVSLQQKVMQRFCEWFGPDSDEEDDLSDNVKPQNWMRGKKSGRKTTADDRILKNITWPHFYVYKSGTAESVKYNDLSVQEFVYGFCCQVLEEGNDWRTKVQHLKDLMQDASDYNWENARNFHGIVLNQIERKRLTWANTEEIANLRRRYAQTHSNMEESSQKDKSVIRSGVRRSCKGYNINSCKEPGDHMNAKGDCLVHTCAYCWRVFRKDRRHRESECRSKQSSSDSKN